MIARCLENLTLRTLCAGIDRAAIAGKFTPTIVITSRRKGNKRATYKSQETEETPAEQKAKERDGKNRNWEAGELKMADGSGVPPRTAKDQSKKLTTALPLGV